MISLSIALTSVPATQSQPPSMEFRGVLIDVARNYHSIQALEEIVQWCDAGDVPFVVLHLTDDQNWMLPSSVIPNVDAGNANGKPAYTRLELLKLQEFAKRRGVTLIPEVDMPGHNTLLVRANPSVFQIVGSESTNCINFASDDVRERMTALIEEVSQLFPASPYFHLGGDEAWYPNVEENPDFVAAMKSLGDGATPQRVFADFLGEMSEVVVAQGKAPLIWEGFGRDPWVKNRLPREAVIIAWEGNYYRPQDLLADGYKVINAGWDPFYVVNHYPYDLMTLVPLERLLHFNPQQFGLVQRSQGFFDPIQAPESNPFRGVLMCWWEGREYHVRDVLGPRILALGLGGRSRVASYEELLARTAEVKQSLGPAIPVPDIPSVSRRSLTTGKRVISDHERDPIYGTQNLTDGVVRADKYWLAFPAPVSVTVDFGGMESVGRINVVATPIGGGTPTYVVWASNDGQAWREVVDRRANTGEPTLEGYDDKFAPVMARYLRLELIANSRHPNFMVKICEFSAYGE